MTRVSRQIDIEEAIAETSDFLSIATAWAEIGVPVFSVQGLSAGPDAKKPFPGTNGFNDATRDPEQLLRWHRKYPNSGVGLYVHGHVDPKTGDPVPWFALDVDNKLGKSGAETLLGFMLDGDELPITISQSTPSGGNHYVFQGSLPSSVERVGNGLDIRGEGGYIVAYGPPSTANLAPAPAWLLTKGQVPEHSKLKAAPGVELDAPHTIERARNYIRAVPPGVIGQGSDKQAYVLAAKILGFGLSGEAATEVLFEEWGNRSGFDFDWIESKVYSAGKSMQNEVGCEAQPTPGAIYDDDVALAPPQSTANDNEAGLGVPFRQVRNREVPAVREIIPGLVEKGIPNWLAGPGGSNKSRLALQWGLCIDTASSVFGQAVEQCTLVYLSSEDHAYEVARRAQKIAHRLGLPEGDGIYCDRQGQDSALVRYTDDGKHVIQPFHLRLTGSLKAISGHKFVVLDSCYDYVRFAGKTKIDEGAVNHFVKVILQGICDECDATLLVIWHPSQAGQDRDTADGWSVAWHNAPRARLSISAVKDSDDAFELKVVKRNHGAKGKPITLYWSDGALLPASDVDVAEQGKRFQDACVKAAMVAAEQGCPLQKQTRPYPWVFDDIELAAGFRPRPQEIKNALFLAVRNGTLRYVNSTRHRTAGFYPKDRADELACAAKKRSENEGGND